MLTSIQGYYRNGTVHLDELPADINDAQVIVTFLSKYVTKTTKGRLNGDFSTLLSSLQQFSADFMFNGREQPSMQERESPF